MAEDWDTPDRTPVSVSVELRLNIPASGLAADISAWAEAIAYDATGAIVTRKPIGDVGVRALLTTAQKAALADLMTTLHGLAVTKLLP